jgi:hypothetical protein
MHYRRLIALLMVCAYLILPLDSFANLEPRLSHPHQGENSSQGGSFQGDNTLTQSHTQGDSSPRSGSSRQSNFAVPGGSLQNDNYPGNGSSPQDLRCAGESDSHCPCSDRHGSDGCNPGCSCCSCCSFCAPLPAGVPLRTARPTTAFSVLGPLNYFPKVYLPIFVPPQNRS